MKSIGKARKSKELTPGTPTATTEFLDFACESELDKMKYLA